MKQLTPDEWKEPAHPLALCVLPLDSREIEQRLGLRFFTHTEEGLGELEGCGYRH